MLSLAHLEEVVLDQLSVFRKKDVGTTRNIDFDKYLSTKQIVVVSGIRRSGKSTLLAQFSKNFNDFYYINFDDERLIDFSVHDFKNLMIVFKKIFNSKIIFIDEVQNIFGWERFIRRLYEEGYKVFVTGSNAKLLSSELATHLTGRYFKIELYPFSFEEILRHKKIDHSKKNSSQQSLILKEFDKYARYGGFPEMVKHEESEFLKRIYEDVLYRDLIARFKIKGIKAFKQLANFLFTNITSEISYNSLSKNLGFKSAMSVKNYISFMQEAYLVFELFKYDYSLKKQFVSEKKIYAIDNGMRDVVSFSFSEDLGKLLENLVFIELKRRGCEIYYFKNKKECDFLVKEKNKITTALQVIAILNHSNSEREIDGLIEAVLKFKLKQGLILTMDREEIIQKDGIEIHIVPVWKWLLGNK